jgi:hypothetical protein
MFASCTGYKSVLVRHNHIVKSQISKVEIETSTLSKLLKLRSAEKIQWANAPKEKVLKILYNKYFALPSGNVSYDVINRVAVKMILNGNYTRGEILLKDIIGDNSQYHAAYNNLGVLYELEDLVTIARKYYLRAGILDPDNEIYRRNFLLLHQKKVK